MCYEITKQVMSIQVVNIGTEVILCIVEEDCLLTHRQCESHTEAASAAKKQATSI